MAKAEKTRKVVVVGSGLDNERQEMFCQFYASGEYFGNATRAYAEAYGKDIGAVDSPKYKVVKVDASLLLTHKNVRDRITDLLNDWLTDRNVDGELAKVVQQDGDLGPKVSAIKEYNRVRARVQEPGNVINILNVTGERIQSLAARAARVRGGNEPE